MNFRTIMNVACFRHLRARYERCLINVVITVTGSILLLVKYIYYSLNYLVFQSFDFDLMKVIPETGRL